MIALFRFISRRPTSHRSPLFPFKKSCVWQVIFFLSFDLSMISSLI